MDRRPYVREMLKEAITQLGYKVYQSKKLKKLKENPSS